MLRAMTHAACCESTASLTASVADVNALLGICCVFLLPLGLFGMYIWYTHAVQQLGLILLPARQRQSCHKHMQQLDLTC